MLGIAENDFKNNIRGLARLLIAPEGYCWELIDTCHTPWILKWRNASAANGYLFERKVLTEEMQRKFLENYENKGRLDFILVSLKEKKPVGLFSLTNLFAQVQLGKLIGEKEYKGKGLAKLATSYLIKFAFEHLKISEIYAKTQKENVVNIKLNEKLGFVIIGEENLNSSEYFVMKISKGQ